ncbi:endonuclease/exonuclease/phosphatase family protein [Nocardiopsis coralliicola]
MTWNVWWRFGDWERRADAVLTELRAREPDIVGLQEVWGAGGTSLADRLADGLGMHRVFAPWSRTDSWRARIGSAPVDVGTAVLSRWPISATATAVLPADPDRDDGRTALLASIDAPGARIPFCTVHLSSDPGGSALRCRQVAAVAGLLAEEVPGGGADGGFPPVVVGDLNAPADSDEVRLLGGYRTAPPRPGHLLIDAWEFAEPGAPAVTWDRSNPNVPFGPDFRIDYIHVGPPGRSGAGDVIRVRRAGDTPHGGIWPSDHFAVVADLAPPG